jgi:hypothetical protein
MGYSAVIGGEIHGGPLAARVFLYVSSAGVCVIPEGPEKKSGYRKNEKFCRDFSFALCYIRLAVTIHRHRPVC